MAGPLALARRRDSQPHTLEPQAPQTKPVGAAHGARVGPAATPRAIRELYFFDGRFRKKNFVSVGTSKADEGEIKPVPRAASLATAPRACYLPRRAGGLAGRGARLLPSSRQPPAGPAAALRGGGSGPGRKHPPPAFAGGLERGSSPRSPLPVPSERPDCSPVPSSQVGRVAAAAVREGEDLGLLWQVGNARRQRAETERQRARAKESSCL